MIHVLTSAVVPSPATPLGRQARCPRGRDSPRERAVWVPTAVACPGRAPGLSPLYARCVRNSGTQSRVCKGVEAAQTSPEHTPHPGVLEPGGHPRGDGHSHLGKKSNHTPQNIMLILPPAYLFFQRITIGRILFLSETHSVVNSLEFSEYFIAKYSN